MSDKQKDLIREVFLRNGFTIKDGRDDLADYVYAAAHDLLQALPAVQGDLVAWATRLYNAAYHAGHSDTVDGGYTHVYPQDMDSYHEDIVQEWLADNPLPAVQGERLADQMRAAGMMTIDEMMAGTPLDGFIRNTGVHDLDSYGQWLDMKCRHFLSMQAKRELNKEPEDDMYEWVLAHAAAFKEARINFNAARSAKTELQPELAKYQPCRCVVCICEHETQCMGCGAKHCGTHPVGHIPVPAYQQPDAAPQPVEQQPAPDTLIGRTVSMDVSTGNHDAFRRLFGVITGVEGRDGVILCELTEDNQDVQPAPDVAALVELLAEARDHVVSSTQPVRGGFIDEIDTALTTYRKEGEV